MAAQGVATKLGGTLDSLPEKRPKMPQSLRNLTAKSPKPGVGHILDCMAQKSILKVRGPPAKPHFCGFYPSEFPH